MLLINNLKEIGIKVGSALRISQFLREKSTVVTFEVTSNEELKQFDSLNKSNKEIEEKDLVSIIYSENNQLSIAESNKTPSQSVRSASTFESESISSIASSSNEKSLNNAFTVHNWTKIIFKKLKKFF